MSERIKVALIGNPNTGKSSVFNLLTGLQQKTGNYPGITVEKKEGFCRLTKELSATIFDLPGTYSLNASSLDENVVIELLMNRKHKDFPDVAVIVADVENIKRNLLLFTQIKDLGIPSILVVNMSDRMRRKGISLDVEMMEQQLNTKIVLTSTLQKKGIDTLKTQIANYNQLENSSCLDFRDILTILLRYKRPFPISRSTNSGWLLPKMSILPILIGIPSNRLMEITPVQLHF